MMSRTALSALVGIAILGVLPATANAGGFSFGFSYGRGCYAPAYAAPVYYGGCAPVVYTAPYYSPVVYTSSYYAPVVYSRPVYRVYSSPRVYYSRPRHVVYYR